MSMTNKHHRRLHRDSLPLRYIREWFPLLVPLTQQRVRFQRMEKSAQQRVVPHWRRPPRRQSRRLRQQSPLHPRLPSRKWTSRRFSVAITIPRRLPLPSSLFPLQQCTRLPCPQRPLRRMHKIHPGRVARIPTLMACPIRRRRQAILRRLCPIRCGIRATLRPDLLPSSAKDQTELLADRLWLQAGPQAPTQPWLPPVSVLLLTNRLTSTNTRTSTPLSLYLGCSRRCGRATILIIRVCRLCKACQAQSIICMHRSNGWYPRPRNIQVQRPSTDRLRLRMDIHMVYQCPQGSRLRLYSPPGRRLRPLQRPCRVRARD